MFLFLKMERIRKISSLNNMISYLDEFQYVVATQIYNIVLLPQLSLSPKQKMSEDMSTLLEVHFYKWNEEI